MLAISSFQLVPEENLIMKDLITKSAEVETRGKSVKINSFPLSSLFDDNLEEYFMYWSTNDGGDHDLKKKSLWIVSPNPVSVNELQVCNIYNTNYGYYLCDNVMKYFSKRESDAHYLRPDNQ
jgi:hypothetical protein